MLEAGSTICRGPLRLVAGGAYSSYVTDEEQEARALEKISAVYREVLSDLPADSPWRIAFQRSLRSVEQSLRLLRHGTLR
jgi:hypothetical protein